MSFSISYVFRLIDQFTPGAAVLAGAAGRIKGAMAAAGASVAGFARAAAIGGGVIALALTATFMNAAQAAAKFEDAMANVRKVVPEMSKDEMWSVGNRLQEIAVMTGKPAEKVAEITAAAARAGIRGTEALDKMTKMAAKVAVAWDDVSEEMATTSLTFLSGKFFPDLGSNDMMDRMVGVADAINYLGQTSRGAKPDQILKFFDNAGADLARFGMTAEEASAFASTALMAGQGFGGLNEGTRAASSLSRLMSAASNPTKKQMAALKKLKLSRKEWKQMLETAPTEALLEVMERAQGLDKITKQGVLEDIIGDKRAGRQMARMSDRMNEFKRTLATVSDKWAERLVNEKDFMEWMRNAYPEQAALLERTRRALHYGSVDKEFEGRMDSYIKQSERLTAAWQRMQVAIGRPVLGPLTTFKSALTDIVSGYAAWMEKHQEMTGYLASGAMVGSVVAIGAALTSFVAWAGGFASSWAVLAALGVIALKFTVLVTGIAAVMWIYDNWQKLKEWGQEGITFRMTFPEAPDWMKNAADYYDAANQKVYDAKRWVGEAWDKLWGTDRPAELIDPNNMAQFNWNKVNFSDVQNAPGFQPASAIAGVSVSTSIEPIQVNAGQLTVKYEGPILGPQNVPLSASSPRGTSTVEGGATAPAGAK